MARVGFLAAASPLSRAACLSQLERNPEIANAIRGAGSDVCSHGWRWIKHFELSEEEEREHIRKSVHWKRRQVSAHSAGIADTVQEPIPAAYLLSTVGFFTTAITTVTSCRFGRQSTDTHLI